MNVNILAATNKTGRLEEREEKACLDKLRTCTVPFGHVLPLVTPVIITSL